MSLFATSDLARRVAERKSDVESVTFYHPATNRYVLREHSLVLRVRNRERIGVQSRFWQLRRGRAIGPPWPNVQTGRLE